MVHLPRGTKGYIHFQPIFSYLTIWTPRHLLPSLPQGSFHLRDANEGRDVQSPKYLHGVSVGALASPQGSGPQALHPKVPLNTLSLT